MRINWIKHLCLVIELKYYMKVKITYQDTESVRQPSLKPFLIVILFTTALWKAGTLRTIRAYCQCNPIFARFGPSSCIYMWLFFRFNPYRWTINRCTVWRGLGEWLGGRRGMRHQHAIDKFYASIDSLEHCKKPACVWDLV